MRYSKFAKTAAVVCGIILLVMIGIAASVKQTQEIPKRDDIVADKTNIIAGIVTAQPGEKVEFPIYVVNNAHGGFAIAGIRLFHDEKLIVSLNQQGEPVTKMGVAADDFECAFSYNKDNCCVGLAMFSDNCENDDGVIATIEITVPSDARDGDKYPITVDIDKLTNKDLQPIGYAAVNGYIIIQTV